MRKLFDLRFVIGAFFTVVGILLLIYGFIVETEQASPVNRWCGGVFTLFGLVMIILSFQKTTIPEDNQPGIH
jgi:hypothetical protein